MVEGTSERNAYIDFLRALSLIVVVLWHWVFTIVLWRDDGPHATNPIGFTTGLFLATWLLQVMPLFFYIGGYGHLTAWRKARQRGVSIWAFTGRRLQRLAVPSLALLGVWVVLGSVLGAVFDIEWVGRAVLLVVSPLWFIAVYLVLVAMLPVALWLHERFDSIVLVFLVGAALGVDIARFRYELEWLGLLNMLFVWGLCHQAGFFYDRIVSLARRVDWTLLWAGLFGLAGLVGSGLYPGSMVGVPGERSNMAPPSICIVALVAFQAGVAEIIRPSIEARLVRPRWERANEVINRFSMPLFLFHTTGMALHRAVKYAIAGNRNEPTSPDAWWWLTRPFAVLGPLLFTLPVIYLFGRRWVTRDQGATPMSRPVTAKR
ncbi:MAG: acyltransferase [Acidimicrobiales bacterium]|nr:acyltransferase [Acidimicrobiales bacterium]MCB9394708.1 acyltransferase [Acidimicrobiaceae bacterium]